MTFTEMDQPRAKTAKEQAQLKRGGHEMKKIFDVQPRIPSLRRPQTVDNSSVNFYKYGHSMSLIKHEYSTCEKHASRDRAVLQQRYLSYPVSVPDISQAAANETRFRRTANAAFLAEDEKLFRKKFSAECTSDYFNQKHLIRHYLNTMHPYTDHADRGRKYNVSRLKEKERDLKGLPLADFLQPEFPLRQRETGYSAGHTRTILGLDVYGPSHAERVRLAREVGELPPSPNIDRERAIERAGTAGSTRNRADSPSNSTVSTAPSTAESQSTRRKPKKMDALDDPMQYLPPNMSRQGSASSHNYRSNNQAQDLPVPDFDDMIEEGKGRSVKSSKTLEQTAAFKHGFDPMPSTTPGERIPSRQRSDNKKPAGRQTERGGGTVEDSSRWQTTDQSKPGTSDTGEITKGSAKSQTSRGGHKPPGYPKPPNEGTQTGKLGYHGVAVTRDDRNMKDPIGRGIDWYNQRVAGLKKSQLDKIQKLNENRARTAIAKDADAAVIDLAAFDVALEFRRTAKPADLPENSSKRNKFKAMGGNKAEA